jgi:formate dehydrogenase subunit delta
MNSSQDEQPWVVLVKMANQIANNVAPGQNQNEVAKATADHLMRFWARSMKKQIISCLDNNNNLLEPAAEDAVYLLEEMSNNTSKV